MSKTESNPPVSTTSAEGHPRTLSRETAHDLRALLNVIVGFAANLRDQIVGPLNPAQHAHAARIIEAAESAAALVDAQTATPTAIAIDDLVGDVVSLLEDAARAHGAKLTVNATSKVTVAGNVERLRRIVLNLVSNAIKFSPRDGQIRVEVERIAAEPNGGSKPATHVVRIRVADEGPGIPLEDRSLVFEMGTRLARDYALPGSGIGLAVVKRGVELSGGTVEISDSPGGGATFVVELPAVAP